MSDNAAPALVVVDRAPSEPPRHTPSPHPFGHAVVVATGLPFVRVTLLLTHATCLTLFPSHTSGIRAHPTYIRTVPRTQVSFVKSFVVQKRAFCPS